MWTGMTIGARKVARTASTACHSSQSNSVSESCRSILRIGAGVEPAEARAWVPGAPSRVVIACADQDAQGETGRGPCGFSQKYQEVTTLNLSVDSGIPITPTKKFFNHGFPACARFSY